MKGHSVLQSRSPRPWVYLRLLWEKERKRHSSPSLSDRAAHLLASLLHFFLVVEAAHTESWNHYRPGTFLSLRSIQDHIWDRSYPQAKRQLLTPAQVQVLTLHQPFASLPPPAWMQMPYSVSCFLPRGFLRGLCQLALFQVPPRPDTTSTWSQLSARPRSVTSCFSWKPLYRSLAPFFCMSRDHSCPCLKMCPFEKGICKNCDMYGGFACLRRISFFTVSKNRIPSFYSHQY